MDTLNVIFYFALHALLVASAPSVRTSKHVTVPLQQRQSDNVDGLAQTLHAVSRHGPGKQSFAIAPETLE